MSRRVLERADPLFQRISRDGQRRAPTVSVFGAPAAVMQPLLLIIWLAWFPLSYSALAEPQIMELTIQQGALEGLRITTGESVASLLAAYCSTASLDDCVNDRDIISQRLYNNVLYTPSLPSATLSDFMALRHDVLSLLRSRYAYKSYLEIGCATDENFKLFRDAFPLGSACVDPSSGGTHRMTSDDFFSQLPSMRRPSAMSSAPSFDLVFVDGLHEAAQAAADVFNSLRFLAEGGTIVMHDCNPLLEQRAWSPDEMSSRADELGLTKKLMLAWNGDVWKTAAMIRLMEGVEIVIVDVDHGVGVVRRRRNKHRMRPELEKEVAKKGFDGMDWDFLQRERNELLRLVTLEGLKSWLDEEEEA